MDSMQTILKLVSDTRKYENLRIYYSGENVVTKDLHTIISDLRTDKTQMQQFKSNVLSFKFK